MAKERIPLVLYEAMASYQGLMQKGNPRKSRIPTRQSKPTAEDRICSWATPGTIVCLLVFFLG